MAETVVKKTATLQNIFATVTYGFQAINYSTIKTKHARKEWIQEFRKY